MFRIKKPVKMEPLEVFFYQLLRRGFPPPADAIEIDLSYQPEWGRIDIYTKSIGTGEIRYTVTEDELPDDVHNTKLINLIRRVCDDHGVLDEYKKAPPIDSDGQPVPLNERYPDAESRKEKGYSEAEHHLGLVFNLVFNWRDWGRGEIDSPHPEDSIGTGPSMDNPFPVGKRPCDCNSTEDPC